MGALVIDSTLKRRAAACVAPLLLMVLPLPAAQAEPLLTRNQNALLALYGLPSPLPSRLPGSGASRLASVVNWSNTEKDETSGDNEYTVDAEVLELRLQFDRGLGDRYAVHVELPWRRTSGGSLDGFIDDWHGVFGLPGGSRRRLPEDDLLIEFRQGDATLLQFDESASGVGDVSVAVACQLHIDERSAVATWLTVKAPVGSAEDLSGSGATDVAVTLSAESRVSDAWQLFGQASVAWLGEGDVLPERQKDFAWSLMGGLSWNAWRALDFTTQIESNSKVYDGLHSDLDGSAVVLTLGGSWRSQGDWRFDVGVSEDLQPGASPDIAFNFAAGRVF